MVGERWQQWVHQHQSTRVHSSVHLGDCYCFELNQGKPSKFELSVGYWKQYGDALPDNEEYHSLSQACSYICRQLIYGRIFRWQFPYLVKRVPVQHSTTRVNYTELYVTQLKLQITSCDCVVNRMKDSTLNEFCDAD